MRELILKNCAVTADARAYPYDPLTYASDPKDVWLRSEFTKLIHLPGARAIPSRPLF